MKLLGISGGPKHSSKTRLVVKGVLDYAAQENSDINTEVINVSDLNVQFCDARNPSDYEGDSKLIIDKIIEADALVFGSPMYRGTYTGILKNVFDLIPNEAMIGKPVGLVATGGSDHHYLALEHELKPILGFFLALVVPGSVYANNNDFSEGNIINEELKVRMSELGASIVNFYNLLLNNRLNVVGAIGPTIQRKSLMEK